MCQYYVYNSPSSTCTWRNYLYAGKFTKMEKRRAWEASGRGRGHGPTLQHRPTPGGIAQWPYPLATSMIHGRALLAVLSVTTRICVSLQWYQKRRDDIFEHMQNYSASARIYRCSISPESIRVSFIYIFPKERIV